MSDVKRFTGFIAIDGTTHTSAKSAIEHSRQVKIKTALKDKFGTLRLLSTSAEGHEQPGGALDEFIYANRDQILSALNQEVLTRKKRTPKAKADAAPETAAVAETV